MEPAGDLKNTLLDPSHSPSRVLRGQLCLTLAEEVAENQAWNVVARHSPLFAGPIGPVGAAWEEHLLLQKNASAVGLLHATCAPSRVSIYIIYASVVSECVSTQRVPSTSPSLAGWPGGCWERGATLAAA